MACFDSIVDDLVKEKKMALLQQQNVESDINFYYHVSECPQECSCIVCNKLKLFQEKNLVDEMISTIVVFLIDEKETCKFKLEVKTEQGSYERSRHGEFSLVVPELEYSHDENSTEDKDDVFSDHYSWSKFKHHPVLSIFLKRVKVSLKDSTFNSLRRSPVSFELSLR